MKKHSSGSGGSKQSRGSGGAKRTSGSVGTTRGSGFGFTRRTSGFGVANRGTGFGFTNRATGLGLTNRLGGFDRVTDLTETGLPLDTAAPRLRADHGRIFRVVAYIFLVPFLGLTVAAGVFGWQSYVAVTESQEVTGRNVGTTFAGTVTTGNTASRNASSRSTTGIESAVYHITYEFTDATGQVRQARSLVATNVLPSPAEDVALLWNPDRPEVVRRAGFLSLWGLPAAFAGFGLIFLVPALVFPRIFRPARPE